jgi:hypothetical protein
LLWWRGAILTRRWRAILLLGCAVLLWGRRAVLSWRGRSILPGWRLILVWRRRTVLALRRTILTRRGSAILALGSAILLWWRSSILTRRGCSILLGWRCTVLALGRLLTPLLLRRRLSVSLLLVLLGRWLSVSLWLWGGLVWNGRQAWDSYWRRLTALVGLLVAAGLLVIVRH